MFYMNIRHNTKKEKSSKNTYHYLTRTAHFAAHKDNEIVEFSESGNMPTWAQDSPMIFWKNADQHEIERGRTSTVITIALPKELSKSHRADLAKALLEQFVHVHKFPYTAVIHHHGSKLTGEEQPHLHLMYSERSLIDEIDRPATQFFKQYRPKNPTQGGSPKLTANALGQGKNQVNVFRALTEKTMNAYLKRYAPTKTVVVNGQRLTVLNEVSCLSNVDYNKKYGTNLLDVPQIPRWKLHSADPNDQLDVKAQIQTIQAIREHNNYELYKEIYLQSLGIRSERKLEQAPRQYQSLDDLDFDLDF